MKETRAKVERGENDLQPFAGVRAESCERSVHCLIAQERARHTPRLMIPLYVTRSLSTDTQADWSPWQTCLCKVNRRVGAARLYLLLLLLLLLLLWLLLLPCPVAVKTLIMPEIIPGWLLPSVLCVAFPQSSCSHMIQESPSRLLMRLLAKLGLLTEWNRLFLTGLCLDVRGSVPPLPHSCACQTDMRFGRFSGSSAQMGP